MRIQGKVNLALLWEIYTVTDICLTKIKMTSSQSYFLITKLKGACQPSMNEKKDGVRGCRERRENPEVLLSPLIRGGWNR